MTDDELRALGYTGRCDHLGGPENCNKQPGMYCVSCDGPMSLLQEVYDATVQPRST